MSSMVEYGLGEYPPDIERRTAPIRRMMWSSIVAKNIREDAVSVSVMDDYTINALVYKIEVALVAGEMVPVTATVKLSKPSTDTRWDTFKLWLRQDLEAGWLIRRFWLPVLEEKEYSESNTEEFYVRYCPHFDTSRSYDHIQWLGYK